MDFCLISNFFIGFDACKYIIWLLYFYISAVDIDGIGASVRTIRKRSKEVYL